MIKKIMLINPPWYSLFGGNFDEIPIGLCYIAANLDKAGYQTCVYNADFLEEGGGISDKYIFDNYEKYKEGLNNLEGSIWQTISKEIRGYNPDLVGIHIKTGSYKSAQNVAQLIKRYDPSITVVVGGPHPTILPKETLDYEFFDIVVNGEGEETFIDLVDTLDRGESLDNVLGITFRRDDRIVDNEPRPPIKNLDELPFPLRDVVLYKEKYPSYAFGVIITARGCPFECIYCASHKMWGRRVRFRSPENIIQEIKEVKNKHRLNYFKIRDDTFTLNKKRAMEICDLIIKERLDIVWHCDTRADCVDEELIKKMKEAGCTEVSVGVESGSERILKFIKKGENKEQIRNAIRIFKEYGISVLVFIMIGFPTETEEEVKETINFAKELKSDSAILSIVTPYPGTELFEIAEGMNLIKKTVNWEEFFHQSQDMNIANAIPEERFRELQKWCFSEIEGYNNNIIRLMHRFMALFYRDPREALSKARAYLDKIV